MFAVSRPSMTIKLPVFLSLAGEGVGCQDMSTSALLRLISRQMGPIAEASIGLTIGMTSDAFVQHRTHRPSSFEEAGSWPLAAWRGSHRSAVPSCHLLPPFH